jgi:hypothetical protein
MNDIQPAAALTDALLRYGQDCYAVLTTAYIQNDLVMRIFYAKGGYREFLVYSPGLYRIRSESNHRALEANAFEEQRCEDVARIIKLCREIAPERCTESATFALDLHAPSPAGLPRFKIEIAGREIASKPCSAHALVKKLLAEPDARRGHTTS